jgi:hypothetical protein
MTTNPRAKDMSTGSKSVRGNQRAKPRVQNPSDPPSIKIKSSTHLCITIRWGVEAAAPASTAAVGGAPC